MNILKKDLRNGEIKVQIASEEDLWHLSHIINGTDLVKGSTERKVKIGDDTNFKVVRKHVFLVLEVEKVEYEPENNALRVLGRIKEGPDDVSIGSYHSFSLEINDTISIVKDEWPNYLLQRLNDSLKKHGKILVVLFDREDALFAVIKEQGYDVLFRMSGDVQRKDVEGQEHKNFYKEISEKIVSLEKVYEKIVIGSSGFWREYLRKELPGFISKKLVFVDASDVNESSLTEILKNPVMTKSLDGERLVREVQKMDELMKNIRLDKAFYGLDEAREKISSGCASLVLVSENFLKNMKEKEAYKEVDSLLKLAESMKAELCIITNKEVLEKLDNLGGIAGVTRWKI